jgi:hypothetical protein
MKLATLPFSRVVLLSFVNCAALFHNAQLEQEAAAALRGVVFSAATTTCGAMSGGAAAGSAPEAEDEMDL